MPMERSSFTELLVRLGLDLARHLDVGHQSQMHEKGVLMAKLHPHLADRLEKRQRLDVTHSAADLHQTDVGITRTEQHTLLDLVGDVGNQPAPYQPR